MRGLRALSLTLVMTVVVAGTAWANPSPPPDGLWQPPPGVVPEGRTSVYLESRSGDYIGQGGTYRYTLDDAKIGITHNSGVVSVGIDGNEWWHADFSGPDDMTYLQPGYYGDLQRYPFHNPVKGGLAWGGEGRGCNELVGWFVVDDIQFSSGAMTRLALRFEQRCEGSSAPPLYGQVRYEQGDTGTPGNPRPPPADLWDAPSGSTPDAATYIYLESTSGDYIGAGGTYVYTPANAQLGFEYSAGYVRVNVNGDEWWHADFAGPEGSARLERGYYGDLRRYPFHNPMMGGLDWSGDGRGCNELYGWFIVDDIVIEVGKLISLTLRFGQHCESPGAPPLHGKIRYNADGVAREPAPQPSSSPSPRPSPSPSQSPSPTPAPTPTSQTSPAPDPSEQPEGEPPPDRPYSDIDGNVHEEAILAISDANVAEGYADGTFRPYRNVTRGQMATFVARALRLAAPDADAPTFSDIKGHVHADAIRAIADEGVAGGYQDGTFRPDRVVTRSQMATFIARAFDVPIASAGAPTFSDISRDPHRENIRAVADAGIAAGYPDGTYRPGIAVNRGQMATFLARAMRLVSRAS